MRSAPIQLTQDMLRSAYERRKRHDWPTTFEAAMADAICSRLVRIEAWCAARRQAAAQAYADRRTRLDATKHKGWQLPLIPTAPTTLDHKRRAAGERADD